MRHLQDVFGVEWAALSHQDRANVAADFSELARDEYDVADPTVDTYVEWENLAEAASEYRRRIGKGNLASYARCLCVRANLLP